jgi:hypothetical protein
VGLGEARSGFGYVSSQGGFALPFQAQVGDTFTSELRAAVDFDVVASRPISTISSQTSLQLAVVFLKGRIMVHEGEHLTIPGFSDPASISLGVGRNNVIISRASFHQIFNLLDAMDAASGANCRAIQSGGGTGKVQFSLYWPGLEQTVDKASVEDVPRSRRVYHCNLIGGGAVKMSSIPCQYAFFP